MPASHCSGFSCCRTRAPGRGLQFVQRFNCPAACGVFLDQESNPHFLHGQATSLPLSHVYSSPSTHCEVNTGPLAFPWPPSGHTDLHWCVVLGVLPIHPSVGIPPVLQGALHVQCFPCSPGSPLTLPAALWAHLKDDGHFCSVRFITEIILSVFLSTCPLLILFLYIPLSGKNPFIARE